MFRYQKVYEAIKNSIENGNLAPGEQLPAENSLAANYNVDRSTIRKALDLLAQDKFVEKRPGKGNFICGATRVQNAKDPQPQSVSASNKLIGFFVAVGNIITEPFYSNLFYYLNFELQRNGYSLIYSAIAENDNLSEMINRLGLSGIVFVSNVSEKHISAALQLGKPCVLLNGFNKKISCVLSDNVTGAYLAGKYLLQCHHRNIAVLAGVRSYYVNNERMTGFKKALQESGINLPEENILNANSWQIEGGRQTIEHYLQTTKHRPTAVFTLNDRLAFGAWKAIHNAGLKVPDDISLIGYDNLSSPDFTLKMTTIDCHVHMMAEATARAILWQIELGGSQFPSKTLIPVELVKGETVRTI